MAIAYINFFILLSIMLIERVKNIENNTKELEVLKATITEINTKIMTLLELINKLDDRLTSIENL
jgi:hypothetical protein